MTKRGHLSAFALASAFIASSALAGCHQEHLSSNYGQSYAAWFSSQHVNRAPSNPEQAKRVMDGLDAQEASNVSKGYRRMTGRDDSGEGGGRLLMISPNRGGNDAAGYIPPPSVPMSQ